MKNKTLLHLSLIVGLTGCGKMDVRLESSHKPSIDLTLPSLTNSQITVSSNNIADGVTPAVVTLLIRNSQNEPLPGLEMSLNVSGQNNTIIPCTATNSSGTANCWVYSNTSELKVVNAEGTITLSTSTMFHPAPPRNNVAGIVSSGSREKNGSQMKVISSSGVTESPARATNRAQAHADTAVIGLILSN